MSTSERPPAVEGRTWHVTVPSMLVDHSGNSRESVITVGYNDARRYGFVSVPVIHDLRDFADERVYQLAASQAMQDVDKLRADAPALGELARLAAPIFRDVYIRGYMNRLTEERTARAPIARDQLRSLVAVIGGWPL